jgi:hypothetical protein
MKESEIMRKRRRMEGMEELEGQSINESGRVGIGRMARQGREERMWVWRKPK